MTDEDNALAQILAAGLVPVEQIVGVNCTIELKARPPYCNRGNWVATIEDAPFLSIDLHDAWPRYYFDPARAKLELEAWLDKRGERIAGETWQTVEVGR